MVRISGTCRCRASYLRLLQEAPITVDKLKRPLRGSALSRWFLDDSTASSLRISAEWRELTQAKLNVTIGKHIGVEQVPQVFLRTLIHPSYVRSRQLRDTHGMPAEMLYTGRSLLELHSAAVLLHLGEQKLESPTAAAVTLLRSAGLTDCVLWRRESFALHGTHGNGPPGEVAAAAGSCLVGAVSTLYGHVAANNLLAELCPIPKV